VPLRIHVQQAIEEARALVSQPRFLRAPVDVFALAREVGVAEFERREMSADGYLGQRDDGTLVVRYRSANSHHRNRFTVAHEIGHILLCRIEGTSLAARGRERTSSPEEETAANRIASELLMPVRLVRGALAAQGHATTRRWGTIAALRHYFDVSRTAMAIRMLEIPGLDALLFRINVEGRGSRFPFDLSENARFRLLRTENYETDRLWRETRRSNRHRVPINTDRGPAVMHCEGLMHSAKTRYGSVRQYWVIGWMSPEPTGQASHNGAQQTTLYNDT